LSQIDWLWQGDTSVGDAPSDAEVEARVSAAVAATESPVRIVKAASPWSMLRRRSNATERGSKISLKPGFHVQVRGQQLTDATSQGLEIALLGPPGEAVVVDFAGDAGVGAGAALRPLSVACCRFRVSTDGQAASRLYVV
jgi:hypothetical protein